MTSKLAILAALALGLVAGIHVPSYVTPEPSSAYECRFGFSPHDSVDFDREWDRWGLEIWRASQRDRHKWITFEAKATGDG